MDLEKELNPAQREAVTTLEGPVLVIAGAGSGKTRTIVHRLARLVNMGVAPASILLLTFTRKAAQEMLDRAGFLLGPGSGGVSGVSGGTFHSFAYATLRRHSALAGFEQGFTVMDRPDAEDVVVRAKEELGLGKGDKSFPKKGTITELIGKSRNKETAIRTLLEREAFHLLPYAGALEDISERYAEFKASHGLMDYDDLLFRLERLLLDHPDILERCREQYRYIMVDEYQDTNPAQARLVALLAGESGNVMAVGDDAQSIYAFRGADVENILGFPKAFQGTKIVKLEQNYRSTRPILDLTNEILRNAGEKFDKSLFSEREDGSPPEVLRPFSDMTQAKLVTARVRELRALYPLHEIAVLFRAGYQSYPVEVELNKIGVPFQKFGGLKFSEAAHVKEVIAYLRVVHNLGDMPGWSRILAFVPRVGKKTAARVFEAVQKGDHDYLEKLRAKNKTAGELFAFIDRLRAMDDRPDQLLEQAIAYHTPLLMEKYPDDYPRRQAGLEQLAQIAAGYASLDAFLADLAIEKPDENRNKTREDHLVLSTVHSAKGLEYSAVIIIDLVDDRFPSKHALAKAEDLDEERRLLYVACTRAKDFLALSTPETIYSRQNGGCVPALPSVFVRELPENLFIERREQLHGRLFTPEKHAAKPSEPQSRTRPAGKKLGFCRHKIFGRGKIVAELPGGKYRINFPGMGLKTILADYVSLVDE